MPKVWKHTLVVCTTSGVIVSALLVAMGRSTLQEAAQAVALPDVEVGGAGRAAGWATL
jgi:hypothetical protein